MQIARRDSLVADDVLDAAFRELLVFLSFVDRGEPGAFELHQLGRRASRRIALHDYVNIAGDRVIPHEGVEYIAKGSLAVKARLPKDEHDFFDGQPSQRVADAAPYVVDHLLVASEDQTEKFIEFGTRRLGIVCGAELPGDVIFTFRLAGHAGFQRDDMATA